LTINIKANSALIKPLGVSYAAQLLFISSRSRLKMGLEKWENNEEIQIFREYLRIPTVHPDVDYSKVEFNP